MTDVLNIINSLIQLGWPYRGYVFALLMFILGLKFKTSKYVTWLYGLYFWVLIGLNTVSADYNAYEEMYYYCNAARYATHEIGYMSLCKLFYAFGASFELFRAFIGAVIVVLLITGIKRLTDKPNLVFALMLVFPVVSFVSGLRNSLSMAIIIHGFYYLMHNSPSVAGEKIYFPRIHARFDLDGFKRIDNEETRKTITFVIYVIIASLFHYASVFYFIFIYAKYCKRRMTTLLIQTFALIVVAIGLSRVGFFYNIISRYTSREKTLYWFSSNSGSMSVSVLYVFSIMLMGILLYLLFRCKKLAEYREHNQPNASIAFSSLDIQIVTRVVIVSMLAFAGAVFSSVVFLRWVLTPIPLAYCVFSTCLSSYCDYDNERQWSAVVLRMFLYAFAIFVALFVFGYWIGGDSLTMYTNNIVFQ